MKERLTIVKVGGAVVEDEVRLGALLDRFASIATSKLLVHGGGRAATQTAARLGLSTTMIEGRRVTDADMLDVVTMVYGGLVNKRVVAQLQARGVNALGLTGADMDIIRSHRRPPVKLKDADGQPTGQTVDYGYVGDVDRADGQALQALIERGVTPVVAPLTHDGRGTLLNTNADTMAQTVATALAPLYDVTLIFAFEKAGVLTRPDDDSSVIANIDSDSFRQLKADGVVSGGMVPKIENALSAVAQGVGRVVITSADCIAEPGRGTSIQLRIKN